MNGTIENHISYQPEIDEYSDAMKSPFRLLHISSVEYSENKYYGYAILVKTDDKTQVAVKLTGNRNEKSDVIGMLNSLAKLVRVEHSLATGRGFRYKDIMEEEQIESYKEESRRIRDQFVRIGIRLP